VAGEILRMIHVTNERHSAEYQVGIAAKDGEFKEKYVNLLKEFEDLRKIVSVATPGLSIRQPNDLNDDFGIATVEALAPNL
jgi:hypothetical protein